MSEYVAVDAGRITVRGEMTIYAAAELKDRLFPSVQQASEPLQIDLSRVTALDTAGLQILLMLQRIAADTGVACRLVSASDAVMDVLNLCGLGSMLKAAAAQACPR